MGSSKSKLLDLKTDIIKKDKNIDVKNIKNIKINNISKLSKDKIDEFIEELLKNENINLQYLPDSIEKKIYKNVFSMIFSILIDVTNNTKISVIGHEITITIKPESK
jgi:hypothetical protein